MDWQLFGGYLLIGVGVSAGFGCELATRPGLAERYIGRTRVSGSILFVVFWPAVIAGLITLALCAWADK